MDETHLNFSNSYSNMLTTFNASTTSNFSTSDDDKVVYFMGHYFPFCSFRHPELEKKDETMDVTGRSGRMKQDKQSSCWMHLIIMLLIIVMFCTIVYFGWRMMKRRRNRRVQRIETVENPKYALERNPSRCKYSRGNVLYTGSTHSPPAVEFITEDSSADAGKPSNQNHKSIEALMETEKNDC
ncbi:hypothetical protein HELRODRAFT_161563 [Helobdella robusta]|uniref:Uncharacterized protein n=1 Tax=Helobdella robusta TaxID=6412 RepID=T1ERM1_HELRO|nr:hypothetical protein HELRODRAFT_161563 [Helobdella robusta]ESO02308.1 hypothetical protein HELRODRAFT_161563 [Helobdella robusta]